MHERSGEGAPSIAALRVASLTLEGFRNLSPFTLEPGARFNVLFGDNGAGKSNLLEAIGYLATLRSFRQARKEDLLMLERPQARLLASLESAPLWHELRITLERAAGRGVLLDGKRPRSLGSYYGLLPLVLFQPADTELMMGAPEARRAFLDRMLEQIDVSYARTVDDYAKALRSRNRLLKAARVDARSVHAYDTLLSELGAHIGRARAELTAELKPLVEAHFAEITAQALPIELSYAARHPPERALLERTLSEHYERDLLRGFTSVGPHGDDLRVSVRETSIKHYASQGQHRALVLALKVAELSVLARRKQRVPLLLLDDVSSELDPSRNRRFFRLLARFGGQVFLSTTQRELILLEEPRQDFEVRAGQVRQI